MLHPWWRRAFLWHCKKVCLLAVVVWCVFCFFLAVSNVCLLCLVDHFEGIRADVSVKCEDSHAVWFSKLEADGKERDGVALFWNRRVLTLSSGGAHCFRLGRGMSQIAVVGV